LNFVAEHHLPVIRSEVEESVILRSLDETGACHPGMRNHGLSKIKARLSSRRLIFFPRIHPIRRHFMKKIALILVCSFCLASVSNLLASVADTPENRRQEAERYLQATPPKAMFADIANNTAASLPPEERGRFVQMMTSAIDIDALTKAMIDAMVKHFTADELHALADFYGSPVGKSAMSKFGAYMADVMPAIQAEMLKAQSKMNQPAPNK
jgi:hypothetical protein